MRAATSAYERDGYLVLRGFASVTEAADILDAATDLARRADAGESVDPAIVTPEANLADRTPADPETAHPEDRVSKIFRIHRLEPFHSWVTRQDLVGEVAAALGTEDVDCFGSQFIFKNPGAWGQPCHQDSHYFPFDEPCPVVGAWLAVTDARADNGCLYVVPRSSEEPTHEHVPDARPNANLGYMEIVDHDLSGAVAVEMEPGDLLLFDSHLMHFSQDNQSTRRRGAMVCHYAPAGTVDHAHEHFGFTIHDWMPVRRGSRSVPSG